jgi:mRNA interferase MazF
MKLKGCIVLDQIRTIDKIRMIKQMDYLNQKQIDNVKSVITETFVD